MNTSRFSQLCAAILLVFIVGSDRLNAADDKDKSIQLAEGAITLTAPDGWVRKQPMTRIVEHEFAVPKAEGDELDGRLTIMGAGGDIEANITRWQGQFVQPNGDPTSEATKTEQKKVAGLTVHLVDITGIYKDQAGGPFTGAKIVERENYRMLAAIVVADKLGNYFIKFYGPQKTVDANEKAFHGLIDSLKKK